MVKWDKKGAGMLSASMMCADFLNMERDLDFLEKVGIEFLHYDVMDGQFVPNYAFSPDMVQCFREYTRIPADIHFMVDNPDEKVQYFKFKEGDMVSVHYESAKHIQRLLAKIREMGARPGIAINPGTPVSMIKDILDDIDFVLLMTVNPGFAGQKLVPHCLEKIKELRTMLDMYTDHQILIEVDGNVNLENARLMRDAGADIFVGGSSGLFIKGNSIQDSAALMRRAIL